MVDMLQPFELLINLLVPGPVLQKTHTLFQFIFTHVIFSVAAEHEPSYNTEGLTVPTRNTLKGHEGAC